MQGKIRSYWERKKIQITPSQFAWGIVAFSILAVVSRNLLKYGVGHSKLRDVCLMLILLIVLSASKKTLKLIVLPFVVLISLYIPIGYSFGAISENYLMALYATNAAESVGMFSMFSKAAMGLALLNIGLFCVYIKICSGHNINLYRNKTLMVLITLVGLSNQLPFAFFTNAYQSTVAVKAEIDKMAQFSQKTSQDTWEQATQSSTGSQYDDYVVVIGESVRKDYMHAYGYPVANTPFLDQVNGVFVDGLKSADRYTIPSLTRMLTKTNMDKHAAQYDKNIISLANKSGFTTVWLSNQGSFGKDDTPIAALAKQAHKQHFLKQGSYDIAQTSDMDLLPFFKQQIQLPSQKKRLFFVHTVGSHPDACQQLYDFPNGVKVKNQAYEGVACYVNSIHKADAVLEKLYVELKNSEKTTQRRFSMVYFSDHGLAAMEEEGKWKLVHGDAAQSNDVPLIKLSSGDEKRLQITADKSGFYFTDGLANWLGIHNAQLAKYDLFSPDSDGSFQEDFPIFKKSFDNPALDVSDK